MSHISDRKGAERVKVRSQSARGVFKYFIIPLRKSVRMQIVSFFYNLEEGVLYQVSSPVNCIV